jgi:hypothetical protein
MIGRGGWLDQNWLTNQLTNQPINNLSPQERTMSILESIKKAFGGQKPGPTTDAPAEAKELPPLENWLKVPIRAGEKAFKTEGSH